MLGFIWGNYIMIVLCVGSNNKLYELVCTSREGTSNTLSISYSRKFYKSVGAYQGVYCISSLNHLSILQGKVSSGTKT